MPKSNDWFPSRRENQLAMAKRWHEILEMKATAWGVPSDEVPALAGLITNAENRLKMTESTDRTTVITAQCKAAFAALRSKMRYLKSHYFFTPPLVAADYVLLELKYRDPALRIVLKPTAQVMVNISCLGEHLLELHLHPSIDSPSDPNQSDYGFRVYYGVLPPGGASIEAARGDKRELRRAPTAGEDLPHLKFTHRKKVRFEFAAEDSGKTAYFCVRYENAKGESGPWSPVFSAVIL